MSLTNSVSHVGEKRTVDAKVKREYPALEKRSEVINKKKRRK
jgi:hypothetical protein